MKKFNSIICLLVLSFIGLNSCDDFEDINEDPKAASQDQTQPYYALNKAIIDAQQSPDEAERVFVYQWKSAARQHQMSFFATGSYSDDFNANYHDSRITNWIKSANLAISLATSQIESGKLTGHGAEFIPNVKEVSRIWRAYLMSEYVDNFGVMPINAFQGVDPEFNSCQDVYYFLLDELKDAASKLDVAVKPTDFEKNSIQPINSISKVGLNMPTPCVCVWQCACQRLMHKRLKKNLRMLPKEVSFFPVQASSKLPRNRDGMH
jgi:hypothetical protein